MAENFNYLKAVYICDKAIEYLPQLFKRVNFLRENLDGNPILIDDTKLEPVLSNLSGKIYPQIEKLNKLNLELEHKSDLSLRYNFFDRNHTSEFELIEMIKDYQNIVLSDTTSAVVRAYFTELAAYLNNVSYYCKKQIRLNENNVIFNQLNLADDLGIHLAGYTGEDNLSPGNLTPIVGMTTLQVELLQAELLLLNKLKNLPDWTIKLKKQVKGVKAVLEEFSPMITALKGPISSIWNTFMKELEKLAKGLQFPENSNNENQDD